MMIAALGGRNIFQARSNVKSLLSLAGVHRRNLKNILKTVIDFLAA